MYLPFIPDQKIRILIRHQNRYYRFLSIRLETRGDGSLYVSFDRKWIERDVESWTAPGFSSTTTVQYPTNETRLSYHPTGLLKPHGLPGGAHYCDPLFSIVRPVHLFTVSIPEAGQLDEGEDAVASNSATIDIETNGRFDFEIFILPPHFTTGSSVGCVVQWPELFTILVKRIELPLELIPPKMANRFVFFRNATGIFETQAVRRDEAFIRMHQAITGHPDLLIYGPNGEGTYLMVFSVPMRIMPIATIKPRAAGFIPFIVRATNHYLKYQLRKPNGALVKNPIEVDVTLDARL